MTNLHFKILIVFFSSLIFFSCKNEKITKEQVSAEIYLRYIEMSQEIHAEANFYSQKTPPSPVTWDNVLFVNLPMKKRQLSPEQIRYIIDLQQPEFEAPYYIKFWNKGELPQQINIQSSKISSFSFQNTDQKPSDFISKSNPIILKIDAPTLSGEENITALFTNENNESASLKLPTFNEGGQIKIPAKELSKLPSGICNVEIIISKAKVNESVTTKSTIISEFYSKPIQISVREG